MAENLLEIRNVSKIFRIGGMLSRKKLTAIDDVSLTITNERPVILSIVGESGCGKSTLCKMILRVHKPDMGEIYLNGKRYSDKRAYDPLQFRLDVQPIFQNPYESFSARKTVDTYLFNTALRLGICKTRKEAEERIDEPVAAIDASMKMNIVNLFKELKDKYNVSFIYITHDLSTAYYVSDYIATLYRGCLIEYGPAKEIMDDPAHPYTELLMNAIPRVGDKWDESMVMPDLEEKEYSLTCCKFAARCPYATDRCRQSRPSETQLPHARKVLCFKAEP